MNKIIKALDNGAFIISLAKINGDLISDLYTMCMKNQIETNQKEMTVNDLGNLLLGLIIKVDNIENKLEIQDKRFVDLDTKIDYLEIRLSSKIESEIASLAEITAKGLAEMNVFRNETNASLQKMNHQIAAMDKKFATKEEVGRLALRLI
jgi:hypothetical protein